jgi:hypothetical protein
MSYKLQTYTQYVGMLIVHIQEDWVEGERPIISRDERARAGQGIFSEQSCLGGNKAARSFNVLLHSSWTLESNFFQFVLKSHAQLEGVCLESAII